ncbi:sulfurtransferase TusA family protein [uncultured Desulfuromonas sp.]|uniref:sulfurtransferase TusA family protein n=1 Tax=uncultured Desulfuromonas sp. TaxID=181013 RepID=UPI002AAB3E32|nr:sulfurtransferase TusA family protein [uncultured Desulfuromonas sp.]
MMKTIEFDICGQICPSALLTALKEINRHREQLKQGRCELVILTDARDATRTIPSAVENMGYQVDISKKGGCYLIRIFTR